MSKLISYTLFPCMLIGGLFLFVETVGAECALDHGVPPPVTKYVNDVRSEVGRIRAFVGASNRCGSQGTTGQGNRFLSALDRIDTQVLTWPHLVSDFQYNIILTSEGGSRGPVVAQGRVFRELETGTILSALRTAANMCALDVQVGSSGSVETVLGNILMTNRRVENYFREVAFGSTTQMTEGIPLELQSAIVLYYSPANTAGCKSDYNFSDLWTKTGDRIGKLGEKVSKANATWKEAIALFKGENVKTQKYMDLQRRLLQTELARQGLSVSAKKAIMKNLTCSQQSNTDYSSVEDVGRVMNRCFQIPVSGLESVVEALKWNISRAKTSDQWLARSLKYDRDRNRIASDMLTFWKKLEAAKNTDESTNEKIITDLVDTHADLVILLKTLQEKTPEMYRNCREGQPDIACPSVQQ